MVVNELAHLTEEDRDLVMITPALVTLLIAGADDNFDKREEARAEKAVHWRKKIGDPLLMEYFKVIDHSFSSVLDHLEQKYEGPAEDRIARISVKLSRLNDVLPQLDHKYAKALLDNWRNMAREVAKASGGIMGLSGISHNEHEVVGLDMITYEP